MSTPRNTAASGFRAQPRTLATPAGALEPQAIELPDWLYEGARVFDHRLQRWGEVVGVNFPNEVRQKSRTWLRPIGGGFEWNPHVADLSERPPQAMANLTAHSFPETPMHRLPNLTPDDYTDEERAEFRALMDSATSQWANIVKSSAPDGLWQPSKPDLLSQLSEADDLLDAMYRSLGALRKGVSQIDSTARRRYLDRAHHHCGQTLSEVLD
jgi:hypothetical protein